MALTINVDGITGIDETANNQTVPNVKNDIDLGDIPGTVQSVFNTALAAYDASLDLTDAFEYAGDSTNGTDGNDVQVIADPPITGLSLTDGDGNLFDGTFGSGLFSLDGNEINLLSASNDNVVLGIDSVTNDVVFAIYIEEVEDAVTTNIIGGDFWVALFEPIKHPLGGDGNSDDVVDLANKLYVSAEQIIDFSFAGAPSGQNEFMAFQSGQVTIVASGEANGDSVNSGQGANLGDKSDKTALGTNSQAINAGQELNFNYTTGFNPDFVVPDLTSTEASDQGNIQFTDVYDTTGAAFNVVKVTGGGASTTPLVHLSAWSTEDAASTMLETGTDFISGHADDVKVDITAVFVNGVDVTTDNSMVLDIGDGTFTVIGAVENDRIKVTTTAEHNRLAIANAGDDQVAFSVQAFSLEAVADVQAEAGSKIDFYDDGPAPGAQKVDLLVYEDALTGGNPDNDGATETTFATDNLSGIFEPGTDTPGLDFGVIASKDGTPINSLNGLSFNVAVDKDFDATVDGVFYHDEILLSSGGTDFFQILVNLGGDIRFEQLAAIDQSAQTTDNPDDDVDVIPFGDLLEAFDEDGDRQTFSATDVKGTIEDDAPVFDISLGSGKLQTDDGAMANGNAGGNASDTNGAGSLFMVDTEKPGADGDGGTVWKLELSSSDGIATTLVDVATTNSVWLFDNGGTIEGRAGTDVVDAATGTIIFDLTINTGTGAVTQTQYYAVQHGTAETVAAYNDDEVGLGLGVNDHIYLRGTLSDAETTPDTATDFIDIASNVSFTDDGPVFDMNDLEGTLQTDDADLTGGDDVDMQGLGSLFSIASELPGADGDGGTVYTLELGGTTVTNLVDVASDQKVVLSMNGLVVEGKTQLGGDLVFTLSVVPASGMVTLTQKRAVEHATSDTSAPYNGDTTGLGVMDAVYLRGTLSDGEPSADSATDAIDLSAALSFTDDGPAITVNDASGTYAAGAQGTWTDDPGEDGFESLGFELVSYEINSNGTVNVDTDLTPDDTNPLLFEFSITDDFNGDGDDETVNFNLEFDDPLSGDYTLTVDEVPSTVVKKSTADGSLDAGGPDPVRTLTIDSDSIVFAAVTPTSTPAQVVTQLNDVEADWESEFGFLSDLEMNVSTAGIGNGNNNFNGNANGGVDGDTTNGGKVDESFVFDPTGFSVSSVKVFIDNSVGGYDNPPEDLWYTVYYSDGTAVDFMNEVLEGSLSNEAGGQVSFLIGNELGPNNIDAVQFYMGEGTIKIPVIEYTKSQSFEPDAIVLNFDATEFDDDGDSDSDLFMVDLDTGVA